MLQATAADGGVRGDGGCGGALATAAASVCVGGRRVAEVTAGGDGGDGS